MSDKRTSLTPIIVGTVIVLLGILTGLYVADNAKQQLAVAQLPVAQAEEMPLIVEDPVVGEESLPSMDSGEDEANTLLSELPALDPVVIDPEVTPQIKQPRKLHSKASRRKTVPSGRARNTRASKKRSVVKRQAQADVDDFVELSSEEVARVLSIEKGRAE